MASSFYCVPADNKTKYYIGRCLQWPICKSEEFTVAIVGNFFCNTVPFHSAINSLRKALEKNFQGISWQRCVFHFTRNMLDSVPRKKRAYLYSDLKTIFLCSSKEDALLRASELSAKFEKHYPELANMLRDDIEDSLCL